jgi:hypothetical protein
MTMILREELYKFRNRKQEQKIKALSEDDFFSRNFNSKKVKFNIYGNGVTTSKSHNPQMLFDNLLKKK